MSGENNTYFKDYSGNGNNGYGNNTVYVDGKYGKAIYFNGINSSVKILSNPSSFNITEKITLFARVNISKYVCFSRILAKSYPTNVAPYTIYGLLLDCNTSTYLETGKKGIRMELASNGSQHYIVSTTSFQEGLDYEIVGTYDSSTGQARFYVNGVLDNSTLWKTTSLSPFNRTLVNNLTNGLIDSTLNNISIGSSIYNNIPADFSNISIQDPGIVNRIWTLDEIKAYFDASINQLDTNITGLSDGVYNLSVLTLDRVGNFNQTEGRRIQLDTTGPKVTGISPTSGNDEDGIVNFVWNVTDSSNLGSCILYLKNIETTGGEEISYLILNNSLNVSISYTVTNVILSNMLRWYVNCSDNLGNSGVSPFYQIDTQIGSAADTQGGGGSGTITNVSIGNISSDICTDTYSSALVNPKDYGQISNILLKYQNQTYLSIKSYMDNWQVYCSDLVNKTLYPEVVCTNIYDILNKTNGLIEDKNITDLKSKIDPIVTISKKLLIFYIENYNTSCYELGYSNEFTKEIFVSIYEENKCTPILPNIFDASIDFLYIDISNSKCSNLTFLNNFFNITGYNERYRLVGIRIYVIIILLLIIFGIRFLFKRRKNNEKD
jgi:hypothetical protein